MKQEGSKPFTTLLCHFENRWDKGEIMMNRVTPRKITLKEVYYSAAWSNNWSLIHYIRTQNSTWLIVYNSINGAVELHTTNDRGEPVVRLWDTNISIGATHVLDYTIVNRKYIVFFNSTTAEKITIEIDVNGNRMANPAGGNLILPNGTTLIETIQTRTGASLLMYNSANGEIKVQNLNQDATLGNTIGTVNINIRRTSIQLFVIEGAIFMEAYFEQTGFGDIFTVEDKGASIKTKLSIRNKAKATQIQYFNYDGRTYSIRWYQEETRFELKVHTLEHPEGKLVLDEMVPDGEWQIVVPGIFSEGMALLHYNKDSGNARLIKLEERGTEKLLTGRLGTNAKLKIFQVHSDDNNKRIAAHLAYCSQKITLGTPFSYDVFNHAGGTYLYTLEPSPRFGEIREIYVDGKTGESFAQHAFRNMEIWKIFSDRDTKVFLHHTPSEKKLTFDIMTPNFKFGSAGNPFSLPAEFDLHTTYRVQEENFLLLFKSANTSGNNLQIHKISAAGVIGNPITDRSWITGWTFITTFETITGDLLFFYNKVTGAARVIRPNSTGFQDVIWVSRIKAGWTTLQYYRSNNSHFLMCVDELTGKSEILRLGANGEPNIISIEEEIKNTHEDEKKRLKLWLTEDGAGMDFTSDYFLEVSRRKINLKGSQVLGWHNMPISWEAFDEIGSAASGRFNMIMKGLSAANISLPNGHRLITVIDLPREIGAAGDHVLSEINYPDLHFYVHEMAHALSIQHAAGEWVSSDNELSIHAYGNIYDVLGFGNRGSMFPLMLNSFSMNTVEWLDQGETIEVQKNSAMREVITINSFSDTTSPLPRVIKIITDVNKSKSYLIEYRTKHSWDTPLDSDVVLIHHIKHIDIDNANNGVYSVIQRLPDYVPGGGWIAAPFAYHGATNLAIKVVSSNPATKQANIYVSNTISNIQIHSINDSNMLAGENFRDDIRESWLHVKPFRYDANSYYFIYKLTSNGENIVIRKMNADGLMDAQTTGTNISDLVTEVSVTNGNGARSALALLLRTTGLDNGNNLWILRISVDGMINQDRLNFSVEEGWTYGKIYRIGARVFSFLYRKEPLANGNNYRIYEYREANNTFTQLTESFIDGNWTYISLIPFLNTTYIFFYNNVNGDYQSRQLTNAGLSANVQSGTIEAGWISLRFVFNNTTTAIFYNRTTNALKTYSVNTNGTIGDLRTDINWPDEWVNIEPGVSAGNAFLFLFKRKKITERPDIDPIKEIGNNPKPIPKKGKGCLGLFAFLVVGGGSGIFALLNYIFS